MHESRDDEAQEPSVVSAADRISHPRAEVVPLVDAAVGLAAVRGARWPLQGASEKAVLGWGSLG